MEGQNIESRLRALSQITTECEEGEIKMSLEDYQLIYERISGDVDAALQAGINAAQRKNVGYQ